MKNIYLDNASSTYLAKEVISELKENFKLFANPSSKHCLGKEVKIKIEDSRRKIAKYIGAYSDEIIFTSGATESNNLAIKGVALANPKKKHIIISAIEHESVINPCESLKKYGYKIDAISVDKNGIINLDELKSKIKKDTLLVSIMHVNNEIGTIEPIEEIAKICKEKNVLFHVDAVQSFAKIKIDVKKIGIDLMSISGHKINAMKGVGALYVRRDVKINPIIDGSEQENKMRSGTENVLGIISVAKAISLNRRVNDVKKSRDRIIPELLDIKDSILVGSKDKRIFNNICISFKGARADILQSLLSDNGIFVSVGSACKSDKHSANHVLDAIGLSRDYTNCAIRISFDSLKALSIADEKYIIEKIRESVERIRSISIRSS